MIPLSKQELKLFALLLRPLRMKEIANEMNLDPRTVDTYQRNMFKKIHVESRIELLIRFYRDKDKSLEAIVQEILEKKI